MEKGCIKFFVFFKYDNARGKEFREPSETVHGANTLCEESEQWHREIAQRVVFPCFKQMATCQNSSLAKTRIPPLFSWFYKHRISARVSELSER